MGALLALTLTVLVGCATPAPPEAPEQAPPFAPDATPKVAGCTPFKQAVPAREDAARERSRVGFPDPAGDSPGYPVLGAQ